MEDPKVHDQSFNDSVKADPHSTVQVVKFLSGPNRDLVLAVLLALSVLVNIWLIFVFRDTQTDQKVGAYNFDFFVRHDFADVKSKVDAHETLINTLVLRQSVQCAKEK